MPSPSEEVAHESEKEPAARFYVDTVRTCRRATPTSLPPTPSAADATALRALLYHLVLITVGKKTWMRSPE